MAQHTGAITDEGTSRENTLLGINQFGICEEKLWPYEKHLVNRKPPDEVYKQAKRYTITSTQVPLDISVIKKNLADGIPVLAGIKMKDGTNGRARANGGYIALPEPDDTVIDHEYAHAVLLVGYDDSTQHFIVRNSWGYDWVRIITSMDLIAIILIFNRD